jgi:hypothetical protein
LCKRAIVKLAVGPNIQKITNRSIKTLLPNLKVPSIFECLIFL